LAKLRVNFKLYLLNTNIVIFLFLFLFLFRTAAAAAAAAAAGKQLQEDKIEAAAQVTAGWTAGSEKSIKSSN